MVECPECSQKLGPSAVSCVSCGWQEPVPATEGAPKLAVALLFGGVALLVAKIIMYYLGVF